MRRAVPVLAALALAACAAMGPPVTRIAVQGGAVTVVAPEGYCVDRGSVRDRADGAFVLIGNCAALSADGPQAPVPVALTANVSAAMPQVPAPSPAELESFLRSPDGRAMLARDDNPASVKVLQSTRRGDVVTLRLRDSSGDPDLVSQDIWRAVWWQEGRAVALTVAPLASRPVSSDAAAGILRAFADATHAASAAAR